MDFGLGGSTKKNKNQLKLIERGWRCSAFLISVESKISKITKPKTKKHHCYESFGKVELDIDVVNSVCNECRSKIKELISEASRYIKINNF